MCNSFLLLMLTPPTRHRYKNNADAKRVWDIASAGVGMGAVPLIFMFFGFELQGDLPPRNFKPLAVFVGCLNIFVSSIFLYATTWDAYDTGLIRSHILPMVIMICLCVWAIVMIWLYAFIEPYCWAPWIKPLADDEPRLLPFKPQPIPSFREGGKPFVAPEFVPSVRQQERGFRHIGVSWNQVPDMRPADVQYRVTIQNPGAGLVRTEESVVLDGERSTYVIDTFQGEPLNPGDKFNCVVAYRSKNHVNAPDGGWMPKAEQQPTPLATLPFNPDNKVLLRQRDSGSSHITAEWGAAPNTRTSDIQYRLRITKPGTDATEEMTLPGSQRSLKIDSFGGVPLAPADELIVSAEYRHMRDSHEPLGGWQADSGPVPMTTRSDHLPADWVCRPRQVGAGTGHVSYEWQAPPATDLSDVQYRVQLVGGRNKRATIIQEGNVPRLNTFQVNNTPLGPDEEVLATVAFRHKGDAREHNAGWQREGPPTPLRTAPIPRGRWMVNPAPRNATPHSVDIVWDAAPGVPEEDVEYRVTVTDARGGDSDEYELPGTQNHMTIKNLNGPLLEPNQKLAVKVDYRHTGDADYDNEGWGYSGQTAASTERQHLGDVALVPRVAEDPPRTLNVQWDAAPDMDPADVEYQVIVTDPSSGKQEEYIVPGTETSKRVGTFLGAPLGRGHPYNVDVQVRDRADAGNANGGWKASAGDVPIRLAYPAPAESWAPTPRSVARTSRDVTVGWDPAPGVPAEQGEYMVQVRQSGEENVDTYMLPGTKTTQVLTRYNGKPLEPSEKVIVTVSYRHVSDPLVDPMFWSNEGEAELQTDRRHLGDIHLAPTVVESAPRVLQVNWDLAQGMNPDDVQYRVLVTNPATGKEEEHIVPGTQNELAIDAFRGAALQPGHPFKVDVQVRDREDAGNANRGWKGSNGPMPIRLAYAKPPEEWEPTVVAKDATPAAVTVSWDAAPEVPATETDYELQIRDPNHDAAVDVYSVTGGEPNNVQLTSFNGVPLKPHQQLAATVLYRHSSEPLVNGPWTNEGHGIVATDRLHLGEYKVQPRVEVSADRSMRATWSPPADMEPQDVEYKVTVRDPDTGKVEEHNLPGERTSCVIKTFNGEALAPGQRLDVDVQIKDRADAEWKPSAGFAEGAIPIPRPPADWTVRPRAGRATPVDVVVGWRNAPGVPPTDTEYRVRVSKPGNDNVDEYTTTDGGNAVKLTSFGGRDLMPTEQLHVAVDYRHKADAEAKDGGWGYTGEADVATDRAHLGEYHVETRLREADNVTVSADWDAPPGVREEDVEYLVTITDPATGASEVRTLPGEMHFAAIDSIRRDPLKPGQTVSVDVQVRDKADAGEPDGGWKSSTGAKSITLAKLTPPPGWLTRPHPRDVGAHHIEVQWDKAPNMPEEDVQYRVTIVDADGARAQSIVPGTQNSLFFDKVESHSLQPGDKVDVEVAYRDKSEAGRADEGWERSGGPVAMYTKGDNLPVDWAVTSVLEETGTRHCTVAWTPPPGVSATDVEYQVTTTTGDGRTEKRVVPGHQTALRIDSVNGEPLALGSSTLVEVEFRHPSDAGESNGGWQRSSGPMEYQCAAPVPHGWKARPDLQGAEERSIALVWAAPPDHAAHEIEYVLRLADQDGGNLEQLVLQEPRFVITQKNGVALEPAQHLTADVSVRRKTDRDYPDGGWQGASGPVPVATKPPKPTRPKDWRIKAVVEEEALADIIVDWDDVPLTRQADVEYKFMITEHGIDMDGDGMDDSEDHIVPGEQTAFMIDEFKGEPIIPGEKFTVNIAYVNVAPLVDAVSARCPSTPCCSRCTHNSVTQVAIQDRRRQARWWMAGLLGPHRRPHQAHDTPSGTAEVPCTPYFPPAGAHVQVQQRPHHWWPGLTATRAHSLAGVRCTHYEGCLAATCSADGVRVLGCRVCVLAVLLVPGTLTWR